jgi:hypothetical protein
MQTVAPPAAPAQAPGTPQAGRWMQSVHADVTVPFDAAAITGAMITSIVLLIGGGVIYWQRWLLIDALIPLAIGALGIWLITTLAFWFRERRDIKTTWWRAEEKAGMDLDGDNHIGRPEPDGMIVRHWQDNLPQRSAEDLIQQRFEEFIAKLYQAGATDTETIRQLGFTETERAKFIKKLREAQLLKPEHSGKSAAWTFIAPTANECIDIARKRVIWRIPSSSSASSPAK